MKVTIHTDTTTLPALPHGSYFHSRELMELCMRTPRHKPYMAVVTDDNGEAIANLLAVVRYKYVWMIPQLHRHVRILGEGAYSDKADFGTSPTGLSKNMVFSMMLDALTRRLQGRTLYMEVSHLSQKMFGYAPLRAAGYFPVRWMSIHNSHHSHAPEERINERQLRRIEAAMARGIETHVVKSEEDYKSLFRLLHRHYWFKPRKFIPSDDFFKGLQEAGHCKMLLTTYKGKTLGCAIYVYSDGDAYLWYSASRRKSYASLHPNAVTFWNTIRYTYKENCQHIRFMDVGLPFSRNPYRDFILSFGGKEVSTFRWFRTRSQWLNKLASWMWRE